MALQHPVAVYNAASNIEAQLVRNILNDAGVEAFVTEGNQGGRGLDVMRCT